MEKWCLLGLFEHSMIFQDLRNMVFRRVFNDKNEDQNQENQ